MTPRGDIVEESCDDPRVEPSGCWACCYSLTDRQTDRQTHVNTLGSVPGTAQCTATIGALCACGPS